MGIIVKYSAPHSDKSPSPLSTVTPSKTTAIKSKVHFMYNSLVSIFLDGWVFRTNAMGYRYPSSIPLRNCFFLPFTVYHLLSEWNGSPTSFHFFTSQDGVNFCSFRLTWRIDGWMGGRTDGRTDMEGVKTVTLSSALPQLWQIKVETLCGMNRT